MPIIIKEKVLFLIKISVIIPAYNIENHIESCLNSILNQSLKDIEIIIINDGSNDNTGYIVKAYEYLDERIRVINTQNKGVSAARNIGLLNAKGKYIFQIDGDDWLETDGLEELYKLAEQEEAEIVIANAYRNNKGILTVIKDGQDLSFDLVKDYLMRKIKPSVCTKLYKKELFVKNNISYSKGVRIGEDLLINFYLIYYANKVVKMEKSFLHYINREDSITNSYTEEITDLLIVFNKIKSFLMEKNIYNKYESEYMYLKYFHTYYMGVVLSYKYGPIHKEIYKRYKDKKLLYKKNKYIHKLLKKEKLTRKIAERLYKNNYYIGTVIKQMVLKITRFI